jgi:hypothetical protein
MANPALTPIDQQVKPKSPLKSKTFWFAVIGAIAHLVPDWKNPQTIAESVAIIGAAYGTREAISKNGYGN